MGDWRTSDADSGKDAKEGGLGKLVGISCWGLPPRACKEGEVPAEDPRRQGAAIDNRGAPRASDSQGLNIACVANDHFVDDDDRGCDSRCADLYPQSIDRSG